MNKTKYTFLVPSYKASFFEEALESIKNQTFTNFKVLVSDDCSPESLEPIYNKVCGEDPRFAYRRNAENMGGKSLVSHWNLLVDMCDTEYLVMASDDDVYDPRFLEEIDGLVRKYPDVDILRAKARRLVDGVVGKVDYNLDEYMTLAQFATTFGSERIVHCLANYVFRTSRLKENGYFPDFPTAAKSDAAAALIMARNGIVTTSDVLFSFRISRENLSSSSGYAKNLVRVVDANLLYVDWYAQKIQPLLNGLDAGESYMKTLAGIAHHRHVENVLKFLMPRMKWVDYAHFSKEFTRRGYLQERMEKLKILIDWLKLKIKKYK